MNRYHSIKQEAKDLIENTDYIFCNAINENVAINKKGFKHITFQKGGHVRDEKSQITRFKLLPLAFKLIELTTTYQEYHIEKMDGGIDKKICYWGLIAILENRKIKVILKKEGNGSIHFWSVVPNWVTNQKRDGEMFLYMKGNPEID